MSTPQHPGQPPQPEGTTAVAPQPDRHSRRAFLFKMSLLLNGAVGAVLAVPILGYILGPALKKNSSFDSWVSLGPLGDFPEGETRLVDYRNPVTTASDGETGNVACWVRRIQGKKFQVFAINCAHLGCPVRWFAQSHLFLCPCHGGAYYEDGSRASGPPERGLFQYRYTIARDHLLIEAGTLPTLSNEACNQKKPLVQIDPQAQSQAVAQADTQTRSSEWPA
ncbi:MAG TPA: Rieske 2Fe-2S domain-containing protein [Terracidiphilus sp.]|nr:Rieske 2Fe-2S domain-containing protein [Terracidiphilus sp.]